MSSLSTLPPLRRATMSTAQPAAVSFLTGYGGWTHALYSAAVPAVCASMITTRRRSPVASRGI